MKQLVVGYVVIALAFLVVYLTVNVPIIGQIIIVLTTFVLVTLCALIIGSMFVKGGPLK